ncbi:MAG TPA: hypothetical protein VGT02_08010 [Methylomirabilota bacterium]|jgi:hypothetical protein|nr:hypothetical protein [Methylomirabilota bacterium]
MRVVGWLGVIAVLAVLLLPRAEGADDKRAVALESETKMLREKVAGLEARLKEMERVVQASGGSLKLVSGGAITIQGGGAVVIKGGAAVDIQGGGGVDIRGATIKLNGGAKPVARIGDTVAIQGSAGQISAGSPTVFSQ